ncbi:Hypothetical_protein [Hexamita inflata]|uniref:Hypothetical_protein n=1 Tax=Hexamita inflata TaxID=28002 RepID=A0AA86U3K5_9EUKA|nr:Hypothetical protein HINF_LOCUS26131 [Hexamita inflata]
MNIQVLAGLLEVLETELTCLFTGLYRQSASGYHLFPYARTHVHQPDKCDFTPDCLYFVQLLCLRVSQQHWLNLGVYSARLPEARRTFPFRSHQYKRFCRLFLLASVVFICKKWYERNACNMQQIHVQIIVIK